MAVSGAETIRWRTALIERALRLFEEMNATGWIEEARAALAAASPVDQAVARGRAQLIFWRVHPMIGNVADDSAEIGSALPP
jgi:hypothetical protein